MALANRTHMNYHIGKMNGVQLNAKKGMAEAILYSTMSSKGIIEIKSLQ